MKRYRRIIIEYYTLEELKEDLKDQGIDWKKVNSEYLNKDLKNNEKTICS